MAKTKPQANLLDDLAAFRARIEEDIDKHPDKVKHALSAIDGALSHLEWARWQERALER